MAGQSYPGGKGQAGVYQAIICQIPPHRVYLEPFLGGGAIMRLKAPAAISIGVDVDPGVIAGCGEGIRKSGARLVCADALEFLRSYAWQGDEFVYCDPPYLMEVRSTPRPIYACEFASVEEHTALLLELAVVPAMVAISGYWSPLYAAMLQGWRTISYPTIKRSGRPAVEWLWMNYPVPVELHDYRYLGQTFRERERIKRKVRRWEERLRTMPVLERQAMLAALQAVRGLPGGISESGAKGGTPWISR